MLVFKLSTVSLHREDTSPISIYSGRPSLSLKRNVHQSPDQDLWPSDLFCGEIEEIVSFCEGRSHNFKPTNSWKASWLSWYFSIFETFNELYLWNFSKWRKPSSNIPPSQCSQHINMLQLSHWLPWKHHSCLWPAIGQNVLRFVKTSHLFLPIFHLSSPLWCLHLHVYFFMYPRVQGFINVDNIWDKSSHLAHIWL